MHKPKPNTSMWIQDLRRLRFQSPTLSKCMKVFAVKHYTQPIFNYTEEIAIFIPERVNELKSMVKSVEFLALFTMFPVLW